SPQTSTKLPQGFLFLCPLEGLRSHNGIWLRNPECPAYWSLDPSGSQRLNPEAASRLGFACLQLEMNVHGRSWHESVYTALSRFHVSKGFDPNGQEIARHLRQPLYEL
ncbi:hypothetical protein C8R44DRAFT_553951, partial [Mycena epipterygia]